MISEEESQESNTNCKTIKKKNFTVLEN